MCLCCNVENQHFGYEYGFRIFFLVVELIIS
jgi:hypothetical protein